MRRLELFSEGDNQGPNGHEDRTQSHLECYFFMQNNSGEYYG